MQITSAVIEPNGKAYFFACNGQYIRYDIAADIADQFPRTVAGNWPGLAEAFPAGFDTAATWNNGRAYFFKGSQYVAYDIDPAHEGVIAGYPNSIGGIGANGKEFWPGLKKAGFDSGLDAVVTWPNG